MPRMIIFDDGLAHLGPMTDLRASFEVRTGMLTTAARIAAAWPQTLAGYWVPDRLSKLIAERANALVNTLPNEESFLCVNGRWAMPDPDLNLTVGEAAIESSTEHIVAAHLRRADAEYFFNTGQLHERTRTQPIGRRVLYKYPWDVISMLNQTIEHDILSSRMVEAKIATDEAAVVGDHPVVVHPTAALYPNVVLDAERGPIMIHENALIRPGAVVCGPCSIGRGSTVLDHALIKPNTVLGPLTKIAGEVGGTIFQGHANKSHDGHLGDSWIGKWVNLGAGTTNSNLLNTYSEVTMRLEPTGSRQRTGLTFLGAIIGDHVKTAIGTQIMTGTVLGTGSMIATTAPPPLCVPRFAWLTDDSANGSRTYRLQKFIDTARKVMIRREVTPSEAYLQLLRELHERTTGNGERPLLESTPVAEDGQ